MIKSVCVYCGSTTGARAVYTEAAKALGRAIVAADMSLVYGGGRAGLMGLIADEVLANGGRAVGVIPELLLGKLAKIAKKNRDQVVNQRTIWSGIT